jgi:hypothetical protein
VPGGCKAAMRTSSAVMLAGLLDRCWMRREHPPVNVPASQGLVPAEPAEPAAVASNLQATRWSSESTPASCCCALAGSRPSRSSCAAASRSLLLSSPNSTSISTSFGLRMLAWPPSANLLLIRQRTMRPCRAQTTDTSPLPSRRWPCCSQYGDISCTRAMPVMRGVRLQRPAVPRRTTRKNSTSFSSCPAQARTPGDITACRLVCLSRSSRCSSWPSSQLVWTAGVAATSGAS